METVTGEDLENDGLGLEDPDCWGARGGVGCGIQVGLGGDLRESISGSETASSSCSSSSSSEKPQSESGAGVLFYLREEEAFCCPLLFESRLCVLGDLEENISTTEISSE